MNKATDTYNWFMTALKSEIKGRWSRRQKALAPEAGISASMLNDILSGRKEASFSTQVGIANACGKTYPDLLNFGRQLVEGEVKAPTRTTVEVSPSIAEKLSRLNQYGWQAVDIWLDGYLACMKHHVSRQDKAHHHQ